MVVIDIPTNNAARGGTITCFNLTCRHPNCRCVDTLYAMHTLPQPSSIDGLPITYATRFSLLPTLSHWIHYSTWPCSRPPNRTSASGCIKLFFQRTIGFRRFLFLNLTYILYISFLTNANIFFIIFQQYFKGRPNIGIPYYYWVCCKLLIEV